MVSVSICGHLEMSMRTLSPFVCLLDFFSPELMSFGVLNCNFFLILN